MIIPPDRNYLTKIGVHQLFIIIRALFKPVIIRRLNLRVNSSQILKIVSRNESDTIKIKTKYRGAYNIV